MEDKCFYKTTLRLDKKTYERLNEIAMNRDESLSSIMREYIDKGLAKDFVASSEDLIAPIIREVLQSTLKPSVERLARLESKSGHMAATAAFLNVQALMDLVPKENRRNVKEMYDKARKMAVAYMKNKTGDWEHDKFQE
jgi:hypothetical protein